MTEKFTSPQNTAPSVSETSSSEEIGAAVQYYFKRFHEHALAEELEAAMEDLRYADEINQLRYGERALVSIPEHVGIIRRRGQLYLAQGDIDAAYLQLHQLGYPLSEYDCGDEREIVELLYDLLPYDQTLDEKTRLQHVGSRILRLLP